MDRQDDPGAVDGEGKEIGDHQAGHCPAQLLFFCLHPMEEREKEGGRPDQHELQSAINRFEAQQVMGSLSYVRLASTLALDDMRNTSQEETLARYRAITVDDVVRVASEIFRPERCSTLIYAPSR